MSTCSQNTIVKLNSSVSVSVELKKEKRKGHKYCTDLLDNLVTEKKGFDVDAVLLYDEISDPFVLRDTLRRMANEGLRVTAQRACPEKLIYRQLYKINESEVQLLEDHA